ncbi:MAG: hypothetical protein ACK5LC_17850 [Coprobacillaceae bacterium]
MLNDKQLIMLIENELAIQRSMLMVICLAYESNKLEIDEVTNVLQILVERLDQLTREF